MQTILFSQLLQAAPEHRVLPVIIKFTSEKQCNTEFTADGCCITCQELPTGNFQYTCVGDCYAIAENIASELRITKLVNFEMLTI